MEIKLLHYCLTIGVLVLAIAKNSLSYNPIRFHCDNYILNTYLYFLLSVIMVVNIFEEKNIKLNFSQDQPQYYLRGSIGLIIGLLFIPPQCFHLTSVSCMVIFGNNDVSWYVEIKAYFIM